MSIKLYSYGAAEEVTGSKHFLVTDDAKILVDCGAFQGKRQESEEKNRNWKFAVGDIDATVLTHAHFDHSGLLPLLVKKGYEGNIYSTAATRDLANIIMLDSAKIQARDAEFLRKQAKKRGEEFDWTPMYDEQDAIKAVNQFVTTSYKRELQIANNTSVEFYDAGHILGSSLAFFRVKDGGKDVNICFSGDLGHYNKPIIRDPSQVPDPDYLVLESTYGDRLHEKTDDIVDKLADVVNRTVEAGGKVLIPAFAIERTQDLIYYLHLAVDQKKIPPIPIYVDSPMATNATTIFKIHPECYDIETHQAFTDHHKNPFGFNKLRYTQSVDESKEINKLDKPAIIISSSGMCEAGRILHHLMHNVGDSRNTILIVGYMARYTLGRRIKEKEPVVKIFGQKFDLRANVEEINALSSHADYQEMWRYVSQLNLDKLKKIFLVHGEPDAQDHLKKFLLEKGVKAVEIIEAEKEYILEN